MTTYEIAPAIVTAWRPPPPFTVSQWADAHRMLPQASAARGGRWRTDTVPYMRGIMDAVHEPGVRRICLMKSHQSSGSESLNNLIGYFIAHDPCAMLMVHPTAAVAEAWSKERLGDMIRSTPALRALVRDGRPPRGSHESESTLALKIFPGGYLALGGANTPNTFARWSVRLAIGDDVDRFPPVVGDEGDPADLLVNRTTSFHDALSIFVSTPTLKGGRIDALYLRSDRRRYFLRCPNCGHEDYTTWSDASHFRVVFEGRDPETARLACPDPDQGGCGAQFDEPDRRAMIAAAATRPDHGWRATAVAQDDGLIGFHVPAMIGTLGDVTLSRLVEKWLSARERGKENLRVFINTSLAEGWEDRGARLEPHALMSRREDYGEGVEVPAAAAAVTAGVDVQDNRFELFVYAWGPAFERWLIDCRVVPGNPKHAETQAALLEALSRRYAHARGPQLPIHATCLDTGFATEEMYDFVLAHQARRIFATKGIGGKSGEPIVGKPSEKRYGKRARPVRLYPINVDDAKAEIYGSLSVVASGPGAMHFPLHLDAVHEEYFAQLCAEHRETRYNKAGIATHTVWVLDRERNEALDGAVLALAAHRLLNPNIRQMAEQIAAAATGQPPVTADSVRATTAPTPGRRIVQSTYLGGRR